MKKLILLLAQCLWSVAVLGSDIRGIDSEEYSHFLGAMSSKGQCDEYCQRWSASQFLCNIDQEYCSPTGKKTWGEELADRLNSTSRPGLDLDQILEQHEIRERILKIAALAQKNRTKKEAILACLLRQVKDLEYSFGTLDALIQLCDSIGGGKMQKRKKAALFGSIKDWVEVHPIYIDEVKYDETRTFGDFINELRDYELSKFFEEYRSFNLGKTIEKCKRLLCCGCMCATLCYCVVAACALPFYLINYVKKDDLMKDSL